MLQSPLPSLVLISGSKEKLTAVKGVCGIDSNRLGFFHKSKIVEHLPTRSSKEFTNCQLSKLKLIESKQPTSGTGFKEAQRTGRVCRWFPAAIRSQSPVYADWRQDCCLTCRAQCKMERYDPMFKMIKSFKTAIVGDWSALRALLRAGPVQLHSSAAGAACSD